MPESTKTNNERVPCGNCRALNEHDHMVCRTCRHPRVPHPTTAPPAPASGTDVTRYLCAAVQQNSQLARRAVKWIINEPFRPVASSPGVDLPCVLRYALAARRRQATLDIFHAAITSVYLAALAIVLVIVLREATTLLVLPMAGAALLATLIVATWLLVLGDTLTTYYRVIGPELNRRDFDPAKAPEPRAPHLRKRLADIENEESGSNVTVFPAYEPFIGRGQRLDMWNFIVATDRPDDTSDEVTPFTLNELHQDIAAGVHALGLKNVTVREQLFVSGADLQVTLDDPALKRALLPEPFTRPDTRVDAELLGRLREEGDSLARPYLMFEVNGWGGELVVTTMLRLTLSPARDLLFVEGGTWLLAPIHSSFHVVDHLTDRPMSHQLRILALSALVRTPGQMLRSLPAVGAMVTARFQDEAAERRQRREISQQRFNYGSQVSLREDASDRVYHHFFQNIDRQMYTKAVTRRAMDRLTDFLEQHQVDISDLRAQQSVFYNSGIFASGNAHLSFGNTAMAVGMNAHTRLGARLQSAMPTNRS